MAINAGDIVRASDIAAQACRANRTANLSIPNNTVTFPVFPAERFDTDNMHDTGVNTSRITFNTAGVYGVGFQGLFESAADYTAGLGLIRLNGSIEIARSSRASTTTNVLMSVLVSTTYQFAVGDYVEAGAFQTNSAAVARNLVISAQSSIEFYAWRVA